MIIKDHDDALDLSEFDLFKERKETIEELRSLVETKL